MKTTWLACTERCGRAILMAAIALAARTAFAAPIAPAQFTFDVTQGMTLLPGCTPIAGSPFGGTCGSETSGPGYAANSGGIGTPSFLPLTPGGSVLGTGTAVDATSLWSAGSMVRSNATLTYSFEATGPASVNFIPIDVLSTGLTAVSGNATATLSLVIRDQGTEANIPPGVHDPDPNAPLLDLTVHCAGGTCVGDWGTPAHLLTDLLCVVNGDNYTVTISAVTTAGKGSLGTTNTASAVLDPVIKLDPPYPATCPVPVDVSLSAFAINTSPGTSTGTAVPEPSPLSLAAIAGIGLGLFVFVRRRRGRVG